MHNYTFIPNNMHKMSVLYVLAFAGVTVGVGLLVIITTAIIAVIVGCIIMKSRQGMKITQWRKLMVYLHVLHVAVQCSLLIWSWHIQYHFTKWLSVITFAGKEATSHSQDAPVITNVVYDASFLQDKENKCEPYNTLSQ